MKEIAELTTQLTQQENTQQELNTALQARLTDHNQQFKSLQREYDYLQEMSQWRINQYRQ